MSRGLIIALVIIVAAAIVAGIYVTGLLKIQPAPQPKPKVPTFVELMERALSYRINANALTVKATTREMYYVKFTLSEEAARILASKTKHMYALGSLKMNVNIAIQGMQIALSRNLQNRKMLTYVKMPSMTTRIIMNMSSPYGEQSRTLSMYMRDFLAYLNLDLKSRKYRICYKGNITIVSGLYRHTNSTELKCMIGDIVEPRSITEQISTQQMKRTVEIVYKVVHDLAKELIREYGINATFIGERTIAERRTYCYKLSLRLNLTKLLLSPDFAKIVIVLMNASMQSTYATSSEKSVNKTELVIEKLKYIATTLELLRLDIFNLTYITCMVPETGDSLYTYLHVENLDKKFVTLIFNYELKVDKYELRIGKIPLDEISRLDRMSAEKGEDMPLPIAEFIFDMMNFTFINPRIMSTSIAEAGYALAAVSYLTPTVTVTAPLPVGIVPTPS